MRNGHRLGVVLALSLTLVLGLTASLVGQGAGAGAARAKPAAVAVVDIEEVFNKLEERAQMQADLVVMQERFSAERERWGSEVRQLEEDLEILAPASDAFKQKSEELARKTWEAQAWLNYRQDSMMREQRLRFLDLYRKIAESSGRYAAENGYNVVLFKEPPLGRLSNVAPNELMEVLGGRKLIWSDPSLEITEALVQRMNNEFRNRRQ